MLQLLYRHFFTGSIVPLDASIEASVEASIFLSQREIKKLLNKQENPPKQVFLLVGNDQESSVRLAA